MEDYVHSIVLVPGTQATGSAISPLNEISVKRQHEKIRIETSLQWLRDHKEILLLIEEDQTVVSFSDNSTNTSMNSQTSKPFNNKCFIIHGHNNEIKFEIARFIDNRLGKKTIILHEQPSAGKAIIEKLKNILRLILL